MTFLTRPDGRIVYPRLCAHARAYALIPQTRQDASGIMKNGEFYFPIRFGRKKSQNHARQRPMNGKHR